MTMQDSRVQGAGTIDATARKIGAPRQVTGFVEARTFAIEYTDDHGEAHAELIHLIGRTWYRAPNGENYAKQLKALKDTSWLGTQLTERFLNANTSASIPKTDAVDIVPETP